VSRARNPREPRTLIVTEKKDEKYQQAIDRWKASRESTRDLEAAGCSLGEVVDGEHERRFSATCGGQFVCYPPR
jgi:hypothetical protein